MKHVFSISFIVKLWKAYDRKGRELGNGFIDGRGRAQFFQDPLVVWSVTGERISPHEILEDVNNQITILQCPSKEERTERRGGFGWI